MDKVKKKKYLRIPLRKLKKKKKVKFSLRPGPDMQTGVTDGLKGFILVIEESEMKTKVNTQLQRRKTRWSTCGPFLMIYPRMTKESPAHQRGAPGKRQSKPGLQSTVR